MPDRWRGTAWATLLGALVISACAVPSPSPSPRPSPAASPSPAPTAAEPTAHPAPASAAEFPLPLVTGLTNLRASATLHEVVEWLASRALLLPCETTIRVGSMTVSTVGGPRADQGCLAAGRIPTAVAADPQTLALLPPGLVEPATKVLPIGGTDPFGGPGARVGRYPVRGVASTLPQAWTAYQRSEVWTLMSLGDSCPDRGVAYQAITLGRGWAWVFDGGWARYRRVYPNPVGPGRVGDGFLIVDAVEAGGPGAMGALVRGADVTVDDFECPVVGSWQVNSGAVFSIDPAVLPHLRDDFGVEVATLAANHLFDQGQAGFLETLDRFSDAGIASTGAGADLAAALEPALVEAGGLNLAFVGFNEVPGSIPAGPGQPGVAWLTQANAEEAVGRARAVGADLVFCQPQWGLPEYRSGWTDRQRQQQAMFFAAGCDHILGSGTHWAGPMELRTVDGSVRVTMSSHGNFLFGQGWSQQTQEGVLVELAFRGTRLVQVRLHPYVVLEQAQPALTDPMADGSYVLGRIFADGGTAY